MRPLNINSKHKKLSGTLKVCCKVALQTDIFKFNIVDKQQSRLYNDIIY